MKSIKEQEYEQAEVREFSLKEVCDILSTLMCFNETGGIDEDGHFASLEIQIKNAMCIQHPNDKLVALIEHIEMIGIQDVATTLSVNDDSSHCEENPFVIAFGADYKKYL